MLLARSGLDDAIDAALGGHGGTIITPDPDPLAILVGAARQRVDVIEVWGTDGYGVSTEPSRRRRNTYGTRPPWR